MIWNDYKTAELKRLHATGMSMSEIAAAMGITRNAAIGKCSRLNLPSRATKPRLPQEELQRRRNERQRLYDRNHRHRAPNEEKKMADFPPIKPAPYVGDLRIPFADLRDFKNESPNQCRYIADEPPGPGYLACGNETRKGESYCPHCWEIVRNPIKRTQLERAQIVQLRTQEYRRAQRNVA
jgi:hypothetical protein